MQAMDQGAIDGASNGSGSTRRSDGWSEQWITEQLKERWVLQAMDQDERYMAQAMNQRAIG